MSTINPIVISDTFQVWLNRTNEVIDVINDNALLASAGAPTPRIGNAALQGTFTSNNLIADSATVPSISLASLVNNEDPINFIDVNSPLKINAPGSQENLFEVKANAGFRPIIGLTNGSNRKWEVLVENEGDTSPFAIRTGIGVDPQLRLSQAGILTVPKFQGDGSLITNIDPSNIAGGTFTGDVTGNVTGNVTGTVSDISNHDTGDLAEGTNQYFTTARARSSISGGTGVTYNSSTGAISIGQNVATTSNVTFDRVNFKIATNGEDGTYIKQTRSSFLGLTQHFLDMYSEDTLVFRARALDSTNIRMFGNVNIIDSLGSVQRLAKLEVKSDTASGGNISATGDITAFASSSDIRKKENIVKINNALDKVSQISGYTYNFKGDDRKITGVIAQELEKVLPEVVYEIDDEELGKSKAVRYGNIVGLLIEAIKELKAEIEELKNAD